MILVLDCGPLAIQTNTSAVYTTTIVNSTVVYYCNSSLLSHILCASGICSPNGSWEIQSCISKAGIVIKEHCSNAF